MCSLFTTYGMAYVTAVTVDNGVAEMWKTNEKQAIASGMCVVVRCDCIHICVCVWTLSAHVCMCIAKEWTRKYAC